MEENESALVFCLIMILLSYLRSITTVTYYHRHYVGWLVAAGLKQQCSDVSGFMGKIV